MASIVRAIQQACNSGERDLGIDEKHVETVVTVFTEQLLYNRHRTENLCAFFT